MKILTVLIFIIAVMHISNLINVTLLDGEWSGIVIWLSSILFLISMVLYGREVNRNRKNNSVLEDHPHETQYPLHHSS